MFGLGSSLFDSPSNCEPTHSAWESVSGWARGPPVDTHLSSRFSSRAASAGWGPFSGSGAEAVRKALNENPMVQIVVLGVLAMLVGLLLLTRVARRQRRRSAGRSRRLARSAGRPHRRTPAAPTPPPATPVAGSVRERGRRPRRPDGPRPSRRGRVRSRARGCPRRSSWPTPAAGGRPGRARRQGDR